MDAAPSEQNLVFAVAGPDNGHLSEAWVVWTRAGKALETKLVDDGSVPEDVPWDGVWTGADRGVPVRDLALQVVLTDLDGKQHTVWSGVVHPADDRHATVAFQVRDDEAGWTASEVPAAWPGATQVIPEAVSIYVQAAWTTLLVAIVAGLVHVTRREGVGW